MPAVQTTYSEDYRVGFPGMIVNSEAYNKISRTANGAIAFGQPVIRVGNHNCVLATQETMEAAGANGDVAPAGATIGTVSAGATAKEGVYNIVCILGGAATASKWLVTDPDGVEVGIATGNTAFTGGGITFTITDAGTDPVVGEEFIVTVTPTVGTADLDILGLSVRDITLGAEVDAYAQYDTVAIMTMGIMWVTAGVGGVTAGGLAYWNPATSKFTAVATHLPVIVNGHQARYDTSGAADELVRLALRG